MRTIMLVIGIILIIIPEPATTGAGILLVLGSFGISERGRK